MRRVSYERRERAIAAADAGSIRERWEYGRLLLVDDAMTTPAGNLRHGVLAGLIAAAVRAGRKVSDREIRRRVQCGRAYPCESQIGQALADFENWWQDPRTVRAMARRGEIPSSRAGASDSRRLRAASDDGQVGQVCAVSRAHAGGQPEKVPNLSGDIHNVPARQLRATARTGWTGWAGIPVDGPHAHATCARTCPTCPFRSDRRRSAHPNSLPRAPEEFRSSPCQRS